MKVLYLSVPDPRNHRYGGEQRNNLLWEAVKAIPGVEVFTLCRSNEKENKRISSHFGQFYTQKHKASSFIDRVIRYLKEKLFFKTSFTATPLYDPPSIEYFFPDVFFDIVVCRYIEVLMFFDIRKFKVPVYIDVDDYPITRFNTTVCREHDYNFVSAIFWRLILKMNFYYASIHWKGAWIANKSDIGKIGLRKNVFLLDNIPFQENSRNLSMSRKNVLLTVGHLGYPPNIHGISMFLQDIWPKVHSMFPQLEYWIVGRYPIRLKVAEWESHVNVHVLANVENLDELYDRCLASVVPVLEGSGTCIKVLESLSYSRICISTPFGARGMENADSDMLDKGIFCYQNSDDFCEILKGLIDMPVPELQKIENKAYLFVTNNYSRDNFAKQVRALLLK